jgi:hypothetical protein
MAGNVFVLAGNVLVMAGVEPHLGAHVFNIENFLGTNRDELLCFRTGEGLQKFDIRKHLVGCSSYGAPPDTQRY